MKYKKGDHIVYIDKNGKEYNGVIWLSCQHFNHYHMERKGIVDEKCVIGLYKEKKENHYLTMEDIAEKFGIKDVESIKIVKILDYNK